LAAVGRCDNAESGPGVAQTPLALPLDVVVGGWVAWSFPPWQGRRRVRFVTAVILVES